MNKQDEGLAKRRNGKSSKMVKSSSGLFNLIRYFDYEAFAHDLFIEDYCAEALDGYVHVFSNY